MHAYVCTYYCKVGVLWDGVDFEFPRGLLSNYVLIGSQLTFGVAFEFHGLSSTANCLSISPSRVTNQLRIRQNGWD